MFGQLFATRVRAAEKALRENRLAEAYRLATSADLRGNRRASEVLRALADRFLDRAREHYRDDRFAEAIQDLDRAADCGAPDDRVAKLRAQVNVVAGDVARQADSQRRRIDAAKERIGRGSLAAGRRILEQAGQDDLAAEDLRRDVGQRSEEVEEIARQVEGLVGQGRFAAASQRLQRAKSIDAHHPAVAKAESDLCNQVLGHARKAICEGRLRRASDELACLGPLGELLPVKRELSQILDTAGVAARALAAKKYSDAKQHAMSLARLLPEAKWIKSVVSDLDRIDDIQTQLAAGPLGERVTGANQPPNLIATPPSLEDTVALPDRGSAPADALPVRLLLLVDGGGSYLILRNPQVSVGRAACDRPADVPIHSDIAERHANIARVDEDYFFFGSKSAEIGGRPVRHQLLRDGDRVVLGKNAKFTFRIPSRQSASAILDLSETTKMPQDVRRIMLFDRHAIVGQGSGAHIICRHASPPLILFERGGALWIRPKNDGHVNMSAAELRIGQATEIGGVSMVLERWKPRPSGSAML